MLNQNVFPMSLKITKNVLFYKKGEKQDSSSYIPISLVPILSKIVEPFIKKQIYSFFM